MSDESTLAELLSDAAVPFGLTDVGPARTASEAAGALGVPVAMIVKSLVCLVDGRPVIALVTGDRSLSLERLRSAASAQAVVLAQGRVVKKATGYPVGAVAPVGHPVQLPLYGDLAVRALPEAYFGGGSQQHILRLAPATLERLAPVRWALLAEGGP